MTADKDMTEPRFAICVRNDGYPASLEVRKLYQVVADPDAAVHHFIRVIDESGEDYLFPEDFFVPIELSRDAQEALRRAG